MNSANRNASKGWQAQEAQGQSAATSSEDAASEKFGSGVAR